MAAVKKTFLQLLLLSRMTKITTTTTYTTTTTATTTTNTGLSRHCILSEFQDEAYNF